VLPNRLGAEHCLLNVEFWFLDFEELAKILRSNPPCEVLAQQ